MLPYVRNNLSVLCFNQFRVHVIATCTDYENTFMLELD